MVELNIPYKNQSTVYYILTEPQKSRFLPFGINKETAKGMVSTELARSICQIKLIGDGGFSPLETRLLEHDYNILKNSEKLLSYPSFNVSGCSTISPSKQHEPKVYENVKAFVIYSEGNYTILVSVPPPPVGGAKKEYVTLRDTIRKYVVRLDGKKKYINKDKRKVYLSTIKGQYRKCT